MIAQHRCIAAPSRSMGSTNSKGAPRIVERPGRDGWTHLNRGRPDRARTRNVRYAAGGVEAGETDPITSHGPPIAGGRGCTGAAPEPTSQEDVLPVDENDAPILEPIIDVPNDMPCPA